jgi:ankyrin repeat protein
LLLLFYHYHHDNDNTMNINHVDRNGRTSLHIACINNDINICKILIKYHINISALDNDGMYALEINR